MIQLGDARVVSGGRVVRVLGQRERDRREREGRAAAAEADRVYLLQVLGQTEQVAGLGVCCSLGAPGLLQDVPSQVRGCLSNGHVACHRETMRREVGIN